MRTRVGRSEEELIRAISEPDESSDRVADLVKRLRPEQLRRLRAMTPGERLDRAFELMEMAHDMGARRGLLKR